MQFTLKIMRIICFICITLSSSSLAFGQVDAHYWTHQFGAKGLLLNGAVISSAHDETSIFYNPGAIAMDEDIGLAFSFLTPTYSILRTNNFLGNETNISDTDLGFSPGFLAARIAPFGDNNVVIGFSSFTRYKSDINFQDRVINEIPNSPFAIFRGELEFNRKISEDWFGISLGFRLNENLGFGISQFSVWHDQRLDIDFKKEVLTSDTPQNVFLSWRSALDYSIDIYGGWISKFGLSYDTESISLGLTVTSPLYGIIRKSADYAIDDQRVSIPDEFVTTRSNRNEVSDVDYKSPLSIGLGIDFKVEKYRLYLSSEYFNAVKQYTVFSETDDSFDGIASGDADILIDIKTSNQAVLNIAIGFEYQKNENVTFLGGLRTDFNESNSLLLNDEAEYLGSTPDVYHLSGGGMFNFGKNTFSFGLDLGYGRRSGGRQLVDLSNINAENIFTFTGNNNVNNHFFSAMLFITYDFIFDHIGD